jgi:hypothetical protein
MRAAFLDAATDDEEARSRMRAAFLDAATDDEEARSRAPSGARGSS